MALNRILLLAAGALGLVGSCRREDPIPDCEINNFGVVTFNFTGTSLRHSILITYPGTSSVREKIVAKGKMSDTIHLRPETYQVSVSSLDNQGQAVDQTNRTFTTTQCSEEQSSIPF